MAEKKSLQGFFAYKTYKYRPFLFLSDMGTCNLKDVSGLSSEICYCLQTWYLRAKTWTKRWNFETLRALKYAKDIRRHSKEEDGSGM